MRVKDKLRYIIGSGGKHEIKSIDLNKRERIKYWGIHNKILDFTRAILTQNAVRRIMALMMMVI